MASAELITAKLSKEQAICFYKEVLKVAEIFDDWNIIKKVCFVVAELSNESEKVRYLKAALAVTAKHHDKVGQLSAHSSLCITYHYNLKKHQEALFHAKKSMEIAKEMNFEVFELSSYLMQAKIHHEMNQFETTILKCNKCIDMAKKTGAQDIEMNAYLVLGQAYLSLKQYSHAIFNFKKCMEIAKGSGIMQVEMKAYLILASTYLLTNEDNDAITYAKKSIAIAKTTNDKMSEMDAYSILVSAHYSLKRYEDVILYSQKCIEVSSTTNDNSSKKLVNTLPMLGKAHLRLKQFKEAILISKKVVEIAKKNGHKMAEVMAYDIQGLAYLELRQFGNAVVMHKEFLEGARSMGDKKAEIDAYFALANTCVHLKRYNRAIYYCKECIRKAQETGEKQFEADAYSLMANVYHTMNECDEGVRFEIKSLELTKGMKKELSMQREYFPSDDTFMEFLNRNDIPTSFLHCREGINRYSEIEGGLILMLNRLDACFSHLDRELTETSRHIGKASLELILSSLALYVISIGSTKKIACLLGESSCDNHKAEQTLEEYLKDTTIAARKNMLVFLILYGYRRTQNQHDHAIECLQKFMALELGPFHFLMNALCHEELVELYRKIDNKEKVVSHIYFGLNYATQCHYKYYGFYFLKHIGQWKMLQGKMDSAKYYLREATRCSESIFDSLRQVSEIFAIKYFDQLSSSHKMLAQALILCNETQEALQVVDQCRARELKETLVSKYRMEGGIMNKEDMKYADIEHLVSTSNYSVVSFFVYSDNLHAFFVKETKGIRLTSRNVTRCKEHLMLLVRESFDEMKVRQVVNCENRSMDARVQNAKVQREQCDEDQPRSDVTRALDNDLCPGFRGKSIEATDKNRTSALEILYRELFADMSIEQEDIVIIPDGPLYLVPYSALRDPDTGQYLSETKRIRIVPSITTLDLLNQRRMHVQCTKSALIVGDPEVVGEVMYLGERKEFPALPFAAAEARVIASILGVKPMIGREATKSAVIEAFKHETAIIHIAAHGSLENATIVLSPSPETTADKTIPDEEDYLLTMADVQSANLHSQLVVLSCCHSGRGEINTEGVVGMCRAFLASGARAVLGSLWAISDDATLEFMSQFYFHLKRGKSASTSLQETIKDTIESREYRDPMYWAPFFLFGDDVTINI